MANLHPSSTTFMGWLLLYIVCFSLSANAARFDAGFVSPVKNRQGISLSIRESKGPARPSGPLYSHNITESSSTSSDKSNSFLERYATVPEPRLLLTDVVSILLATQLMGLVDVLNDPIFWQEGGLFQPIPPVPSTLSALIQRDSVLTICWILAALNRNGYQREAIQSQQTAVATALRIWLDAVVLRFAGEFIFAQVTHSEVDWLDIARQCWFIAALVCSCRYIYSQYNR